ncbi:hypothetical protein KXS07_08280 [Inquilinus limosus]|uniref:hypothetical protein n=1 Tax=Inquilinus limosus TaxID=171674 RepID=UPI003F13CCAA
MRSVVMIFAVAILARIAITPVYYLIEEADNDAAPASAAILAGSRESCEQALAASPTPRARCESISGFRHILGSAGAAFGSLQRIADEILQPAGDVQDAAIEAVQDAAADVVQDLAVDAVQDAIGGDDESPLD